MKCPIKCSSPCSWKLGQNVLLLSLDLDIISAEALSTSSSEWFFSAINDARFVTLSMSDEHQNRDELLAERSLLEFFNFLYFVERWLLDCNAGLPTWFLKYQVSLDFFSISKNQVKKTKNQCDFKIGFCRLHGQ